MVIGRLTGAGINKLYKWHFAASLPAATYTVFFYIIADAVRLYFDAAMVKLKKKRGTRKNEVKR